MLPVAKERAILELLQQGTLSQRQIAVQVGCSQGTVNSICNGKRHPTASQEDNGQLPPDPKLTVGYCPVCERYQYLPCIVCAAKEHDVPLLRIQRQQLDRQAERKPKIELINGERERWKHLRLLKRLNGELATCPPSANSLECYCQAA
jgi:hypothetical protein